MQIHIFGDVLRDITATVIFDTSLLARSALQEIPANTRAINNAHFVDCMGNRIEGTVEMRPLNRLPPLILVTCGFSALVMNGTSIEYGETNLVSLRATL